MSRGPSRVLLVSHAYPPDSSAGTELYTARLAAELARRGGEPTVCTARLRPGGAQYALDEAVVDGIPVFGIVQNWPYRGLPEAASDPAVDRVFERVLERTRPELVAVQSLHGLSLGVIERAAARGIPVVVHLHDAYWSCPSGGQRRRPDGGLCLPVDRSLCGACFATWQAREGPVERLSRRAAARLPRFLPPDLLHRAWTRLPAPARGVVQSVNERARRRGGPPLRADDRPIEARADRVAEALGRAALAVSPTAFLAESLRADGVPLPPVRVVPTGVPAASPRAPEGGGPLRVLFVGTFVPHKGPQVLADALAALAPEDAARIDAAAVGPAPLPSFREEVRERGLGRLRIEEPLPPAAVGGRIARADVVVVPSTWGENAPLVVLEAFAQARPVLASDLGGLVELVPEGPAGRRFPAGDAGALARLLASLAADPTAVRAGWSRVPRPRTTAEWADEVVAAWGEASR